MTCPADDELVRMVEGALGDVSLAAIETHVDGCDRCAAVVAELGVIGKPAQAGRKLASYQLDRRIAAGGMGEVWAAWDPDLEREVAVKLVRPERADDERERARLLREARALAKLAHPNVLAVYDVGEVDGELYLATELVSGDTLASRGGASTDWRAVARLYLQAARGLAAAHAVGLVHRDVKPANLLVGVDGRVRVADFGLAVRAAAEPTGGLGIAETEAATAVTVSGYIAGTPAYMAPEQRAGLPADARCDQFALALALAEGIDGRRPAAGLTAARLRTFFAERRTIDAELEALCAVIARAMSPDADARYREMSALAEAIEAIVGVDPEGRAKPAVIVANAAPNERALARVVTRTRRRIAVGGIAVGAAALAAAVAIGWIGGSGSAAATDLPSQPVPPVPVARPQPSPQPQPEPQPHPQPQPTTRPPLPRPEPPLHVQLPEDRRATEVRAEPTPATDLDAIELAIRHHDGRACAKALAQLDTSTLGTHDRKRAALAHPTCEMIGGDCAKGTADLAALYVTSGIGSGGVGVIADLYCPLDDPATRVRRLVSQLNNLPMPSTAADCERYVAPARAVAAEAHDHDSQITAAHILALVARCMSSSERCDAARGLLHEAGALVPAADNVGELTSACR